MSWFKNYKQRSKEAWERGAKRGWQAGGGKGDQLPPSLHVATDQRQPTRSRLLADRRALVWMLGGVLVVIMVASIVSPSAKQASKLGLPKDQPPPVAQGRKLRAVEEEPESAEAAYADRVEHYWLAEAGALKAPGDDEGWAKLLIDIDALATSFADCETLKLSPQQRAAAYRLAKTLGARQQALFPAIRRHLAAQMDQSLFRQDVRVSVLGKRADVLRFTGAQFVRNANIADMQAGAGPNFEKSRFRRVEYRWSRFFSETTYYNLKVASDATITVADSETGRLRPVKCSLR